MAKELKYICLSLFFTNINILTISSLPTGNLTFVVVIFRHGDRAPLDTYPTDLYKEDIWPNGLQQLTKEGIMQHYELGRYLRKRYEHFLSPAYSAREIYVRSTDYDRTLMSAQANLAGLFPPIGTQVWHPEIPWQPIPVHTVPVSQDQLLKFPSKDCPRYYELMKETSQQPEYLNRMNSWKDFVERIGNYTGYGVENNIHQKVLNVYDTLFCQKSHNYSLPTWATPDVMTTLEEISAFEVKFHVEMHKTNEKARLTGGILVDAVMRNFSEVLQNSLPLKMIMYSAHDSTLVALQGALNVYSGVNPPYASCHMFEFYKESDGSHSVSMFYRNESTSEPYELVLPGCSSPCPLQHFTQLTDPIMPQDWQKECQSAEKDNTSEEIVKRENSAEKEDKFKEPGEICERLRRKNGPGPGGSQQLDAGQNSVSSALFSQRSLLCGPFCLQMELQIPTFFSWLPDPDSTATHAFTQFWPPSGAYAFLPFSMISSVIHHLRRNHLSLHCGRPNLGFQLSWRCPVLFLSSSPGVLLFFGTRWGLLTPSSSRVSPWSRGRCPGFLP
ncbi:testicular acid phosphatase homolog [Rhinophrynus dorsalis]